MIGFDVTGDVWATVGPGDARKTGFIYSPRRGRWIYSTPSEGTVLIRSTQRELRRAIRERIGA